MASSSNANDHGKPVPRVIGNQAKKPEELTRTGAQKMKFVPTLAPRKKPADAPVKQEDPSASRPAPEASRGRGTGRGRGRGRGAPGGGAPAPRTEDSMIASGPFAMGPANVTTERSASKTTFTGGPSAMAALGGEPSSLTNLPPPSLKRDQGKAKVEDLDDEVQEIYSDVEDGIEIIDINDVRKMDWMAPDSLRKEKQRKAQVKVEPFDDLQDEIATAARPSLISETDAELEIEDLIESFSASAADTFDPSPEKFYVFQFPLPFPTFLPVPDIVDVTMDDDIVTTTPVDKGKGKARHVSFAEDVKPPAPSEPGPSSISKDPLKEETKKVDLDGKIGELEIYSDGSVKMRLGNGILLDVNPATQPSFVQHAVHIDSASKTMVVLGDIARRFVVAPDVEGLLDELDLEDRVKRDADPFPDLIRMDNT